MTELAGRVALVTGAARNIGRAIAVALASRGCAVAAHVAQDVASGRETVAAAQAHGARATLLTGDLADPETAPRLVAETVAALGRLDILVNNAAVRSEAAFEYIDYAAWRAVMGVCLDGVFLTTKAAMPHLLRSDAAAVVNLGGLTGHVGAANRAHVVAAKAGVVGLTKALAHEFAGRGVAVNCVVPGMIDTVRGASAGGGEPSHRTGRTNLVGHRGRPEDVAEAVAYLAGPAGRYMAGQTLHVNGGAFLP